MHSSPFAVIVLVLLGVPPAVGAQAADTTPSFYIAISLKAKQ